MVTTPWSECKLLGGIRINFDFYRLSRGGTSLSRFQPLWKIENGRGLNFLRGPVKQYGIDLPVASLFTVEGTIDFNLTVKRITLGNVARYTLENSPLPKGTCRLKRRISLEYLFIFVYFSCSFFITYLSRQLPRPSVRFFSLSIAALFTA